MSDGLAEFLLARIAEDECDLIVHRVGCQFIESDTYSACDCGEPERLAQRCEAKRRIVEHLSEWHEWNEDPLLRLLALPYADHPDFREEWRPDEPRHADCARDLRVRPRVCHTAAQ